MKRITRHIAIVITSIIMVGGMTGVCIAGDAVGEHNQWKTQENLTRRLAAEWYKTSKLRKEEQAISNMLVTILDFELYPEIVTGLKDKDLAGFDRGVELLQKRSLRIKERIAEQEAPVTDALKIMREMVVGEQVQSMFETLEQANLGRISTMLAIKHSLDTLWNAVDSVLTGFEKRCGVDPGVQVDKAGIDREFLAILKKNLGLQSQLFNERVNEIRKVFMKKSSGSGIRLMRSIDMNRIRAFRVERNIVGAETAIVNALACYGDTGAFGEELNAVYASLLLAQEKYDAALNAVRKISRGGTFYSAGVSVEMQCHYVQGAYDSVLVMAENIAIEKLSGETLNRVLWIVIESALHQGESAVGIRYAGYVDKAEPYALHVLHGLARAFLAVDDDSTALSVIRKGQAFKNVPDVDMPAFREMGLMGAELLFEQGNYREALRSFFQQLNTEGMFERALTGIVWCYIKMGDFTKAEVTLRKLINQSPESVAGAEGVLILAKRNLQAANLAWKKYHIIDRQRARVTILRNRLDNAGEQAGDSVKLRKTRDARIRLNKLLKKINSEKLMSYSAIASYYDNASKLTEFIKSHYYTGTYQESMFTEGRELILAIVDSALTVIENGDGRRIDGRVSSETDRKRIKSLVDETAVFSVLLLLNRYQWEKSYIDWKKLVVNRAEKADRDSQRNDSIVGIRNRGIDSLIALEQTVDLYYQKRIKNKISGLLKTSLDKSDREYLEYQLAELFYQEENARYAQEYELYEKQMLAVSVDSSTVKRVDPPRLNHKESMRHYRSVLDVGIDSVFIGAGYYGIGWCFNDAGMFDSAYYYMRYLADHFPECPHTPQAWMYCGEYNFDKGNLDSALAAFQNVMKYPESEWFDEALYKVAWTQYRMSNPRKAISSFLALVDLGQGAMGQAMLEKESMDYVAISFSEIDLSGQNGLRRAAAFVKKLGDRKRGCDILYRLAQVYREQGRYDISGKTYRMILATYPEYEKNPDVEAELLRVEERNVPVEWALEEKYHYFNKYNREGKWAGMQRDSVRKAADSIAAGMLYDAAVSWHQIALQENKDTLYRKTISLYRDYINMYKSLPLANECHYNLAEIQFSLGNYRDAVDEFIAVSREYPGSKYRETAAWNAIVAAQTIMKREQQTAEPEVNDE